MKEGDRVVACGPFVGELGWELMGFSGIVRVVKNDDMFRDYQIMVMSHAGRYPIYRDCADLFVPLPSWYTSLGLVQRSYGADGLTSEIYGKLIKYFRRFYSNSEDVHEIRTPLTHTFDYMSAHRHNYTKLVPTEGARNIRDNLLNDSKCDRNRILVFMPRFRAGVKQQGDESFSEARNWHAAYWQQIMWQLVNDGYTIVVAGTRNGIPPIDYNMPGIIPVFAIDPLYIMDVTLAFMEIAICTICSQSGGTHLALQANCPVWVLGHEMHRHAIECNPLNTICGYFETGLPYTQVVPEQVYPHMRQFIDMILEKREENV